MLYEKWREIARRHAHEFALAELASGRRWTFRELADLVETRPEAHAPILFPRGLDADFIVTVLQAWRDRRVVCPLEPEQTPGRLAGLPESCVHLKSTSASTGCSRLVAFTADQLTADADTIVATMGLKPEWPNLGAISLAHSYGFSNLVLPLLLHGIPLILLESPLPESLRSAEKFGSEFTLAAVPALWRAWHEARVLSNKVRLAISAGAALPLPLEHAVFESTEIKIHNFYGSTECGAIAYDATTTPRLEAGCVGSAVSQVELSVNAEGCLVVRSAAVGLTYWPDPSPQLRDGQFETADLVELRGDNLFLRGRLGDQINVAGRKVLPDEIERALLAHPQVQSCLVFGVPASELAHGEWMVAVVATAERPDRLKSFLLTQLPSWKIPKDWWVMDTLETNARGKLSRREWRERYLEMRSGKT
ncbi:MAG: fatty acid--CoA ligase family protein [Verrucomicrobiota bacterium]